MTIRNKITSSLIILIAVSFLYVSCKKSVTQPTVATINKKDFSLQIVKTFYQGFSSGAVGQKISSAPAKNQVNGTVGCGTPVDSAINHTVIVNGIAQTVTGHIHMSFLCDETSSIFPVAYVLTDSIRTVGNFPAYNYDGTVKENYTATGDSVTPGEINHVFGVAEVIGTQQSHIIISNKTPDTKVYNQYNDFVLDHIVVFPSSANSTVVVGGRATFNVHGDVDGTAYNFAGKMIFRPDNAAYVAFNTGETFFVDFKTGEVEPSNMTF